MKVSCNEDVSQIPRITGFEAIQNFNKTKQVIINTSGETEIRRLLATARNSVVRLTKPYRDHSILKCKTTTAKTETVRRKTLDVGRAFSGRYRKTQEGVRLQLGFMESVHVTEWSIYVKCLLLTCLLSIFSCNDNPKVTFFKF